MREQQDIKKQLLKDKTSALGDIFDIYFDNLFVYGYDIYQDADTVKNAIHDVLMSIWKKRHDADKIKNIKAYLFVALRNRLLQEIKTTKRNVSLTDNLFTEIHFDNYIFENNNGYSESDKAKVVEIISELPQQQKSIVYLKYFHNLRYNEIAEILDIKPQSARNTMALALENLRKLSEQKNINSKDLLIILLSITVSI